MITLALTILVALAFTFFATQNTAGVNLNLWQYSFTNIPLYVIALGALFVGIIVSFIISSLNSISSTFAIRGKNSEIRKTRESVSRLEDRIHELEAENARLRGENQVENDKPRHSFLDRTQREDYRPSLFERLRTRFSY